MITNGNGIRECIDITGAWSAGEVARANGKFGIEEVIIRHASASPWRWVKSFASCVGSLSCKTVPALDQLALGHSQVSQLRNVEFQTCWGGEVELESRTSVWSAGPGGSSDWCGGSIGSELCRQIVSIVPDICFWLTGRTAGISDLSRSWIGSGNGSGVAWWAYTGPPAHAAEFSGLRPQVVFHAAAHKHGR